MRIGIIGSGRIIPFHIEALKAAEFEITSIAASVDSASARLIADKYNIHNYHNSTKSLLSAQHEYDCILIAPAKELLFDLLLIVCERNLPALIEKPVFSSQSQIKLLKTNKVDTSKVMVGYNRRHYKSVQRLKQFISNNKIIHINMAVPELSASKELSDHDIQNTLIGNTVHMLDLFSYLTGSNFSDMDFHLNYSYKVPHIRISTENATCHVTFGVPGNYSIEVIAQGARAELKPLEELRVYEGMEIIYPGEFIKVKKYLPKIASHTTDFDEFKPGFLNQSLAFKYFVKNPSSVNPCSIEESALLSDFVMQISSQL